MFFVLRRVLHVGSHLGFTGPILSSGFGDLRSAFRGDAILLYLADHPLST